MSVNADMIGLIAVIAELLFIVFYTKRGWKKGFAKQLSSLIALLAASGSLLMILKVYTGYKGGDVKGIASGIALLVVISVIYSLLDVNANPIGKVKSVVHPNPPPKNPPPENQGIT